MSMCDCQLPENGMKKGSEPQNLCSALADLLASFQEIHYILLLKIWCTLDTRCRFLPHMCSYFLLVFFSWMLLFLCLCPQSLWFWDQLRMITSFRSTAIMVTFSYAYQHLICAWSLCIFEAFTGCLDSNSGIMMIKPNFSSLIKSSHYFPLSLGKLHLSLCHKNL